MKRFAFIAACLPAFMPIIASAQPTTITFGLTVSAGASKCLPNVQGVVIDHSLGTAENLEVLVFGLPANTGFDLFNIEVPNAPFGLSWYLGDIQTDQNGVGVGNFVGRFNRETFIISP